MASAQSRSDLFETIHVTEEGTALLSVFKSGDGRTCWRVKSDDVQLQPMRCGRCDGVSHTFDIQSMLVGRGTELIAREITKGDEPGYRFAVLGDFEADASELSSVSTPACGRRWRNMTCTEPNSVGS